MGASAKAKKIWWNAAMLASSSVVAGVVAINGSAAQASHVCTDGSPVHYTPPTDPTVNVWEFEGRISAIDTASQTITVNGATLEVPGGNADARVIETTSLDEQASPDVSLNQLVDATFPSGSVVGQATVIARGNTVYDTATSCATFEADFIYVDMAENVLVGPLMEVSGETLTVAGAPVVKNSDTRFPASFTDATGAERPFSWLAGKEGMLIEVEGYYARGALQATHVATEEVLTDPGAPADAADTVAITRAEYDDGDLRLNGSVAPAGTGKTATIYDDDVVDNRCGAGAVALGTANVFGDGTFSFRDRNIDTDPGVVCVKSSGGGEDDST